MPGGSAGNQDELHFFPYMKTEAAVHMVQSICSGSTHSQIKAIGNHFSSFISDKSKYFHLVPNLIHLTFFCCEYKYSAFCPYVDPLKK